MEKKNNNHKHKIYIKLVLQNFQVDMKLYHQRKIIVTSTYIISSFLQKKLAYQI